MASAKKDAAALGTDILKKQLRAGDIADFYIFYGTEAYLRESYLTILRNRILQDSDFDHHRFQGQDADISQVLAAVQTPPFMASRTLVELWDFDPFKAREGVRDTMLRILDHLTDTCCLIMVFTTADYSPDRRMKKLASAMERARVFCFSPPGENELIEWIRRHFHSAGKDIERDMCRYLIFLTGGSMTTLNQEIQKTAAYAEKPVITREDIDTVVTPVLEAGVFDMVDLVSKGTFDQAFVKLEQLCQMEAEPVSILAALGYQLRRLYAARLLLEQGKGAADIQEHLHISTYPARLLYDAARRFTVDWCRKAVVLLAQTDYRLKSSYGDSKRILEILLLNLAQEARL